MSNTPTTKTPAKEKPASVEKPEAVEKPLSATVSVKTSGAFMLVDPYSGEEIDNDEAKTVARTPFVTERLDNGDLVEA